MNDYENLPTGAKLTDEQLKAIYAWVAYSGRQRRRLQGAANFNEADYLAGVMTVFYALESQAAILGGWVFGPLAGRDLFAPEEEPVDA